MEGKAKRYKLWLEDDEKNVPRSTLQVYKQRDLDIVAADNCEPMVDSDTEDEHGSLKVYAVLATKFKKIINDEEKVEPKYFNVRSNIIFPTTVLIEWYNKNAKEHILKQVGEFEEKESQWTLHSITKLEVNVNKYNAIRVGSYIDLPIEIKAKRACINVKNMDTIVLTVQHSLITLDFRKKKHICDRCLHYFVTEERLARHEEECKTLNECKINLPKPGQNFIQFKNYGNREKVPFVIYADCECLLNPVEDEETTCNTEVIQRHEMFSTGYYSNCSYDDSLSKYNSCPDGTDAAKWFVQELKQLAETLDNIFKNPIPMDRLTHDEIKAFVDAQICHICEGSFLPREKKVRDHSHLTGKYRGAAHEKCNLNYQDSRVVPVVFHNLSGYDAHFIIRVICLEFSGKIELLPLNKEKYISFTKYVKETKIKFRFIDSFKFMASSLEKLASSLSEYKIVNQVFSNFTSEEIELLTRKGVLPYEYLDSRQRLEETNLPAKEKFCSTLNDSTVSDEDYLHAQRIWSTFNCSDLCEYVDLYMKTDVLLLADILKNFRHQCLQAYRLDPAHYYTTPRLTWDAMLKYTNVRLELLTDIDKLMFFERGVRGGISQCSNRYACANNPFMENFNKNEEVKYIMYFDANNLYGWNDSPFGYILEVDLDYPIELHNSHSDFPFCSEHSNPPSESKQAKLLTTLNPKRKYIIDYRVLKQVLANGLKSKATNEYEKNLFKLMNNAVYGKTMENVRKHVDVKLVTKWEGRYGAEALISKTNFHSRSIFCENLVAIELRKTAILISKPIYIGFAVLDVSKSLIYDFHYDYMLKKYGESYMKEDIHKFDTSDYPKDNIYNIPQANNKVLGLMKDECSGKIITEFVGLRSKMYSIRVNGQDFTKKAKRVRSTRTQHVIRSRLNNVETVKKLKVALSPMDDKRYLLPDSYDTLAWGHYRIEERD
ncbi:uncharacterized protein LOC127286149 [Leptopilina boulardi]|uniref:uncharacterized protein LOC127286149 n=1 Tax=Leptopilina boulardi TaxID=63433 RepID=UPI0021F5F6A3|nr:uncharacterized protein LOC127286149 [Leptopilina boulardi]